MFEGDERLVGVQSAIALRIEEGAARNESRRIRRAQLMQSSKKRQCHCSSKRELQQRAKIPPVAEAELQLAIFAGLSFRQVAFAHEQVS